MILKLLDLCDHGYVDLLGEKAFVRGTSFLVTKLLREIQIVHDPEHTGHSTLEDLKDIARNWMLPWPATRAAWAWLKHRVEDVGDTLP